jgi:hypothetical protein
MKTLTAGKASDDEERSKLRWEKKRKGGARLVWWAQLENSSQIGVSFEEKSEVAEMCNVTIDREDRT